MTCAEATELAGLYVLDALEPAERALVDAHLATCTEAHAEFMEVGGVVPALATLAEPVAAPDSLKAKVMADYRAGAGVAAPQPAPFSRRSVIRPPASVVQAPVPVPGLRPSRPSWLGWAAAAAAVLLLVVTAGWAYTAQSRADAEAHRAQVLAQAINIMSSPRSLSAVMHGAAQADGARGFAAIDRSGVGYLVLVDLPAAPAGQAYQAWYITGNQPTSAGLLSLEDGGFAVLNLSMQGTVDQVALTLEPAGGSAQPTSNPILSGELTAHA
ncbi:MAG: anti-sigma factor [Chloroflexota bacterium]|nr:anti-sigma factor [Chloroflexota bacterium]